MSNLMRMIGQNAGGRVHAPAEDVVSILYVEFPGAAHAVLLCAW